MSMQADKLRAIGELIRTQDNRITDAPIFIVEQKRRIYGVEDGYTSTFCWVDDNDSEVVCDAEAKAVRDAEREEDGSLPIRWREVGYIEIWEFVTACFTERGCKDYLALDGHNLKEPRIYAAGSYRNNEWRTVRDFLANDELLAIAEGAEADRAAAYDAGFMASGEGWNGEHGGDTDSRYYLAKRAEYFAAIDAALPGAVTQGEGNNAD